MDIIEFNTSVYDTLAASGYSGDLDGPPGIPNRSGVVTSGWFLPSGNLVEPFASTLVGVSLSLSYASACREAIVAEFALWYDPARGAKVVPGVTVHSEEPFVQVDGEVPPQSIWYERRLADVSSERLSQYLSAIRTWRNAARDQDIFIRGVLQRDCRLKH